MFGAHRQPQLSRPAPPRPAPAQAHHRQPSSSVDHPGRHIYARTYTRTTPHTASSRACSLRFRFWGIGADAAAAGEDIKGYDRAGRTLSGEGMSAQQCKIRYDEEGPLGHQRGRRRAAEARQSTCVIETSSLKGSEAAARHAGGECSDLVRAPRASRANEDRDLTCKRRQRLDLSQIQSWTQLTALRIKLQAELCLFELEMKIF